jgi:P27 family predicted phage terminase small subunit
MATAAAGRKSRPTHLKLLNGSGNGRDSGGRIVPDVPKFTRAAPVKPDGMTPIASAMWDAIVAELDQGVSLLKPLDAYALEVGCETFARWHAAKSRRLEQPADGLLAKTSQGLGVSPLVRVESEASREFRAWCAEFGLTPAAEVKLASVSDPGPGDGDLF